MQQLISTISASLIEREQEVAAIIRGIFAQEHVWIQGVPGLAKSLMCRTVRDAIGDFNYFEVLMGPTTTPDDVFGPIDFLEFKTTGRWTHRGTNFLPNAHFALLDELPRASDSLLDSLLHGLGPERQAPVDGVQVTLPLKSAVTATNTFPEGAHLAAIFDRFLIRCKAKRVSAMNRRKLAFEKLPTVQKVTTLRDVEDGIKVAASLPWSTDAENAYMKMLDQLETEGIVPSDRRIRNATKVPQAEAFLQGSNTVEMDHLECLTDVLWDDPQQIDKACDIILTIANPTGARLNELIREVDQIVTEATDAQKQAQALKKLDHSLNEAKKLSVSGNGRAGKAVQYITREKMRVLTRIAGGDEETAVAVLPKV